MTLKGCKILMKDDDLDLNLIFEAEKKKLQEQAKARLEANTRLLEERTLKMLEQERIRKEKRKKNPFLRVYDYILESIAI